MRIDSNTSSSVCTQSLKRLQRPDLSISELTPPSVRDSFQVPPERARGRRLDELAPRFCAPPPSLPSATGAGYPQQPTGGRLVESQKVCLERMEQLHGHLSNIKQHYGEWKAANPNAPEPSDGEKTMSEILELPVHEQCVRILCVVIHEQPQVLSDPAMNSSPEPSFGIPPNELQTQPAPPDFLGEMGKLFGPLAQMLGGLLSSPAGIAILTVAVGLIPGAQPIAAAIPFIAPIAGMALSGIGGMASGQPAAGAPGAMPDLGALISGVSGLLGGAGAVAGAPASAPVAAA